MEKVPRKRAKRPIKKWVLLLILAAAAMAAWGAAQYLRAHPVLPDMPPARETVMLLTEPRESIASMTVTPREGAAYPLVRQGDTFVLEGQEDTLLKETILRDMLSVAECMAAENTVIAPEDWDGADVTLADFGLEDPWVTVTLVYADGRSAAVRFGDEAPDETPQRYCLIEGQPGLFTVLTSETDAFFYDAEALRAFDQPALDNSLLDRIDIAGDIDLGLYYTPSGWYLDAPVRYPAHTARVDSLLSHIGQMAFEACLGDAEHMDLSAYGLDSPALTVRMVQAASVITGETTEGEQVSLPVPETEYTLLIGNETGKSGVYLLWEGQVFKASNFLLGFWKDLRVSDLLLRSPINFPTNDLTCVTVRTADATAAYRVEMVESITENNLIATDEYGRTLYDCEITRDGEKTPMDAETFLNWYVSLTALAPSGELPEDYHPAGEPRAVITLSNEHVTREIALYACDALRDAVSVDGTAIYSVEKSWLDGILRDLP